MPQYTVDIPGKGQFDVDSPVELTDEQAYQAVRSQIGKETPQKEGTAGFFEGLVGGTKNILSASQTAVEAPFISGEEASLRGIERQKERTERPGFSLDEITKAYKEDGIFSAAGETLSQVPGAIGEQLPFLASMKAGFMAGSALPLPPQAKALAGVAGSLLAPFLVSSGSAMERKASEQLKKGDKVDINELGAYGTGLASAGLERAALGLSGLSKVMGIDFLKGAGTETAEQIARRSLAATLAKGGTKLVLAESPTEAGQQLLERYYAGLSLTDEEAQREYVEAAAGAAILAPLGMAGSGYQRSQAKKIIQKRKDEIERVAEENKRIQEEKIRAQEQAEAITAEEAKLERQRIEREAEQIKLEIEAELQRARETGEPIKTIQQIINERTGVVQDPLNEKQLADIAKIDAERDKVFSQLKANRDLGVITEDEYKGKLLFLNDEVNKAKKELSQKQGKEKKPLTKQQLNKRRKEFEEALNLPSGYFDERDAKFTASDVDPETGERTFVERELTQAEAMNIPVVPPPQFNPAKDAVTKEFITSETKGLGIGGTAKAFGLDHGDGPVPFLKDFLDGKNPRDLKDNEMIRLTLNENLKTRRKGLDNAPSLEAQQKRQEVITKIETYLTALPTEGEILNEQFIDEAVRRGDEMAGRPLDPADAALSSIADAGRTDESAAAIDESTRREGEQPPTLDPVTGEPTFTKEEVDAQQAEQLKQQAAELKKGANKTRSFNTLLNKVGIAKEDMLDIMGESKMPRKGFGLAFKTGAPKFVDSLSNGVFNDYLPFNMRLGDTTTYEQLSEKTDKAFEYLTSAMRAGRDLKPFEAELDFDAANNLERQAEEIKPTTAPTQESRTGPPDTERDKLLAQYRADKYMEDSHIRQGERVPKWLQARLKKLEAQLKVQESRNIEGTGESRAAVIDSLRKEFGPDIDKSIESGQLVVVDYLSELPYTVSLTGTANGAYSPTSNKVYIVASKVMPGQGRKVLLHELGEHYGLERLLGKDYKSTLDRLKTLKNTDLEVEAIWASVKRDYPELTENSQQYLQEVMARVGERAPRSTIFKRVMSLVKNFLRKLGFFNPNKLSTADLQDLIAYSTRVSLAKSDKVTNNQIIASSVGLTPVQLSVAERRKLTNEEINRNDKLEQEAETINFDQDYVTVPANTSFYHGTPRQVGNIIRADNNVISSTSPIKSNAGGLTTEGGLVWVSPRKSTAQVYAQMGEDAGNLFEFKNEKPTKLINYRHVLTAKEAEIVNRALNIPDYKRVKAGDGLALAVTHRSAYAKNMAKYGAVNYRDGKVIYSDKDDEPTTDETLAKGYGMGPLRPRYIDRITAPWPIALKALGYDGYFHGPKDFVGGIQVALVGDLQTDLMYSKTDVPAGLEATGVYLAGNNDNSTTVYQNFVEGFEKAKNNPKGILQDIYTSGRINLAYAGAGIERKLINEFEGAVTDGYGTTRADIVMAQALESSVIAAQSAQDGRVQFTEAGTAEVVNDKNNINNLIQLRQQLADQTSVEFAEGLVQSYTSARRYRLELDRLEQRTRNIAARKAVIKTAKKDLKTAKGDDKKVLTKLITSYQKQNERDEKKNESVKITPEQEAAIAPGLAYAQQYPLLIEMGEMIDAINVNRINLLEESGVYSKDKADDYRERKGYVPLFREVLDDLAQGDDKIREYFNGFSDIGREYAFTGSEKASKHVINNLLQQHFWATNAALRNNANYKAAQQVALHNENNELILTDKKPEGNTSAPVFVEGERKFAEYSDPSLAIGIQGALPVYTGALKYFGQASKWFRIGITANPIFQAYQVVNDALGAAMYSGVSNPFQLGKRIIGGFVGDQFMGSTQAIDAQMARLGIAGGFGRTSKDIFMRAQRDLGVENMTKWTKLTDSVESFASKSDLAQRRGIFQQTLIETGGVLQADGTVEGGNQVLAMNRSLNIINWQKRGASGFVRAMTHVIPFANAYLQGMDVLINAMTGKGLSGTDAQTARILFLKTALTLTLINTVYSMLVAGSEEYDELDDRIKFRNYIVPGTGFKLPIRAEISLLTKFIPEQTYQVVSKMNTVNEVDATKLRQAMSLALMDAALGPNLFPQAIRGGVEVATNYNFYTGRPLIGLGLNRLATEEQYNEATSQLSKLLGQTGMIAPINADHLIRSYFGTIGATALFTIDQGANVFFDEKLPAPRLKDFPIISPLIYSAQGRDRLNDFYDLKESSDKVTATVNRLTKYDPDKAREYRKDNKKLLSTRNQVNQMANRLKDLRARRKQVIESTMDATAKRKALENLDKQMSLTARSISRLRIASGL